MAGREGGAQALPAPRPEAKQTELVAWLIEEHLTMSMTAQSRDLNDRKTIEDFADRVQSLDRLKMLLVLTCCDIRAVGPGVWNGWKGQLLRTLYFETEVVLTGGFSAVSRKQRTRTDARRASRGALRLGRGRARALPRPALRALSAVGGASRTSCAMPSFIRETDRAGRALATMVRTHSFHAITEITVLAPDHPRLLTHHRGRLRGVRRQHRRRADLHDLRRAGARHDPRQPRIRRRRGRAAPGRPDRPDDRGRARRPQAPARRHRQQGARPAQGEGVHG